jgi:putative redox protein
MSSEPRQASHGPQDPQVPPVPPPGEREPLLAHLTWIGDLRFHGQAGAPGGDGVSLTLDSNGKAGTSPMQTLALALAGCMGMDVVHVLTKARTPFSAVRASFSGRRPIDPPSRFLAITLHFEIDGDVPDEVAQRAIQLSRDKYCSVWNSMRQDIDFQVTYAITRPAAHSSQP